MTVQEEITKPLNVTALQLISCDLSADRVIFLCYTMVLRPQKNKDSNMCMRTPHTKPCPHPKSDTHKRLNSQAVGRIKITVLCYWNRYVIPTELIYFIVPLN